MRAAPTAARWTPTTLANDLYDFQAVALDLAGNATTSALVADVQVDNAVPFGVAVTAPASPLRGAVTLTATADDDDSGVATVTLQRRTGAGAFVDICTTSTDPYSCQLVTTAGATPDGTYDLRAIAVDAAGNTTTSATVARQIDNSQPSVSLVDPGAYLRGTVTLTANAFTGSGVTSVAIQRAPADGTTFTTICSDNLTPFTCSFVTTAVTDGLYDLRAVMTYAGGQTLTSALVTDRRVDNAAVTGYDVQAENRAGGRAGRVETGDVLVLTWSRTMNTTTLLPGWSGTARRAPRRPARRRLVARHRRWSRLAAAARRVGQRRRPGQRQPQGEPHQVQEDHRVRGHRHAEQRVDRRHRPDGHADHARDGHERRRQYPHLERIAAHGLDAERLRPRPHRRRELGRADHRAGTRRP